MFKTYSLAAGKLLLGNNKAWIGPNRIDLTSDTIYTHPSEIQCNASTEISSLKSSVSNGKSAIASAITGKGVSTAADATFQTMANNIKKIDVITDGEKEIIDSITYAGTISKSRHYRNAEIVSGSYLTAVITTGTSTRTCDCYLDTSYASSVNGIAIFVVTSGTNIRFEQVATAINASTIRVTVSNFSGTYYTMPSATVTAIDDNYITFRLNNASGRAYTDSTTSTIKWTTDLVIKTTYSVYMTLSYSSCPSTLYPPDITVTR